MLLLPFTCIKVHKGKPASYKQWGNRFLLFSNFCAFFLKSWALKVDADEFVFVYKILAQFFENRRNLCRHCLKLLGLSLIKERGLNENETLFLNSRNPNSKNHTFMNLIEANLKIYLEVKEIGMVPLGLSMLFSQS